ncbi:unnamed protein product, partial [marine sediment metagenome]
VDKDKLELKEFLIDYNKSQAESILKSLAQLQKQIDANIIPLRLASYPDYWECRYCQFKEICSMIDEGEVSWENFKKKIESQNK